MQNTELAEHFRALTDAELTNRASCGELTETAQAVAVAELTVRGLPVPTLALLEGIKACEYLGDMVILERGLDPTNAHILCSLLKSTGIAADAGDTNLVQAHSLLAIAVGGVRIRVPSAQLADAAELLAAYKRGEFALGDDFDTKETDA